MNGSYSCKRRLVISGREPANRGNAIIARSWDQWPEARGNPASCFYWITSSNLPSPVSYRLYRSMVESIPQLFASFLNLALIQKVHSTFQSKKFILNITFGIVVFISYFGWHGGVFAMFCSEFSKVNSAILMDIMAIFWPRTMKWALIIDPQNTLWVFLKNFIYLRSSSGRNFCWPIFLKFVLTIPFCKLLNKSVGQSNPIVFTPVCGREGGCYSQVRFLERCTPIRGSLAHLVLYLLLRKLCFS